MLSKFRHKEALAFAKQAIKKLNIFITAENEILIDDQAASQNLVATAIIAYFNAAVESEYLS